jgi:hypothetical protein
MSEGTGDYATSFVNGDLHILSLSNSTTRSLDVSIACYTAPYPSRTALQTNCSSFYVVIVSLYFHGGIILTLKLLAQIPLTVEKWREIFFN